MRLVIVVLLLLTLYLQYGLWYTRGGKQDVEKLKLSVAEQKDEIARLKERNRSLSAEVMDLKQGLEAVEERARSEMGMIKNGEVFFRITDPKHEHDQAGNGNGLANGVEPPLEPPLDPLAPGDAAVGDGPESPAVAQDKPVSVKPMVKAIAKAQAPATNAVAPKTLAPKASVPKQVVKPTATTTPRVATTVPAKAKPANPTAPLTTSKTVTPTTLPRATPKAAPLAAQPLRKPVPVE